MLFCLTTHHLPRMHYTKHLGFVKIFSCDSKHSKTGQDLHVPENSCRNRDRVTVRDKSLSLSTLQVSKAGKLIYFSVGEFLAA